MHLLPQPDKLKIRFNSLPSYSYQHKSIFLFIHHKYLLILNAQIYSMPIPIQNHGSRLVGDHVPKTNQNNPITKPRKLVSLFLKCLVMALVLSLFLIFLLFLGFAALVFLHFLVTSTAFHRRHRLRYRPPLITSSTVLQELSCVNYCGSQQTVKDCAICLDCFKEGDICRNLPACGHLFHVKCVDSWLTRVLNCPICRTRVRIDPANSTSVITDEDWKTWWSVGVSG